MFKSKCKMTMPNEKEVQRLWYLFLMLFVKQTLQADYANIPNGAASLAFVFDTTGSMSDDLEQAKDGAAKILNTTLSLSDKPLYNYVLVPFNDPDIGPVFETTDPGKFLIALANITVDGGGDCPEMSVGAIYKAINVSLPRSFIYVFTDASAKDFNLADSVLSLNQEKRSRVVFWLTGNCGDSDTEEYKAYERIAATSSGQTFVIQKSQVDEVLDSIRTEIQTDKVNLISAESKDDNSSFAVPVDSNLKEVTISVSGRNPHINLIDQSGNRVSDTKTLLDVENALMIKIQHPPLGKMTLDVKTDGPHTVRVTGQSTKDFVIWILPKYLVYTNGTEKVSLTGYSALMYIDVHINGTQLRPPAGFSRIALLNINGTFLREYNLTKDTTAPNTFRTMNFVAPDGYFFVKVFGTDEKGYAINRLMTTAITGLQPQKPKLSMPDTVKVCFGLNATLTCAVGSLIPYSVRWFRNDDQFGEEVFFRDSANATLQIPEPCRTDRGNYICNATNKAGSVTMSTFLNITTCTHEAPVKGKCNCSNEMGTELKETGSLKYYGIGGTIGAGLVIALDVGIFIGCKLKGRSNK